MVKTVGYSTPTICYSPNLNLNLKLNLNLNLNLKIHTSKEKRGNVSEIEFCLLVPSFPVPLPPQIVIE